MSVISYLTGTPGMGKTSYATRAIGRTLLTGRVVAGNVQLREDWAETLARHNIYARTKGSRKLVADDARRRFHHATELEELTRIKLYGRGEGRGLLVLDEAHNELNNRDWQSAESKTFLRWLTSVRHKGWRVLIVSQHADNTDKSARRIADREIRMVNLKALVTLPVVGASVLPWPIFRAYHYLLNVPGDQAKLSKRVRRETFVLGWWRRLFDTHELADVDEPGAIWLPRPAVGRAAAGGSGDGGGAGLHQDGFELVEVGRPASGSELDFMDAAISGERATAQTATLSTRNDAIPARRGFTTE